jgi:predicted tellurium resistance membrane protein TerC
VIGVFSIDAIITAAVLANEVWVMNTGKAESPGLNRKLVVLLSMPAGAILTLQPTAPGK